MKHIRQVLVMLMVAVLSAHAVPPVLNYAGQVAVNGEAFDGNGLFKFALVNTDGNATYWSNDGKSVNGSEPQASVKVPVSGGLYSLLLGNTSIPGMGAIDPKVFAQHSDAKLRVWFSDGVNGFQQLSPDRPFASVPYAFSAGIAQSAVIADGSISKSMLGSDVIAELNKSVTITRDMLPASILNDLNKTVAITREMLPQDVRDDLNRTITITRSMLPDSVLNDLNKTVTITRSMLPADVLSDLNRTISKSMLANDILSDLNSTIGINRLSAEVTGKLERNATLADGSITGNKLANKTITTAQLNEQILKYLKPEITSQPQAQDVSADSNVSYSVSAVGKYLNYQWKKDGSNLTSETNSTLTITDANATLHDGNYSVVVSNDFGSVESGLVELKVKNLTLMNGLVGWWKFDETNGTIAYDSSGNGNDGNLTNGPTWTTGKIGGALSFDGVDDYVDVASFELGGELSLSFWVNCTVFNNWSRILDFANGTNNHQLFYSNGNSPSQFAFKYKISTNNYDAVFIDSSVNSWTHYAGIIRFNGDYEAYKSGSIQASQSGGTLPTKLIRSYHYFGKSNSPGDPFYKGLIDDVRIYDRALSAAEVHALYNLGQ